jgi:hypothetical protein
MKTRIVVTDKLVSVDQCVIHMPELDWSAFDGDPNTPWDDIAAVQCDSDRGHARIEYREIATDQAARHNMQPPDWNINLTQFEEMFGWVIPLHAARKAEIEAERAAQEEAAEQVRQEAEAAALAQQKIDLERQQADADRINRGEAAPAPVVDTSQLEAAVAAKDAEIAALNAKLAEIDARQAQIEAKQAESTKFIENMVAETAAVEKAGDA